MSGEHGSGKTWEELMEEIDNLPWWHYYTPKMIVHRIRSNVFRYGRVPRWWYQRLKRGYSDSDLWGWDVHNAQVNAKALRHLARVAHGWPGEPMTYEEWLVMLEKMARGFEAHVELVNSSKGDESWEEYDRRMDALKQEFKEGMALYVEYYGALWD